jgi:hypothetical protein
MHRYAPTHIIMLTLMQGTSKMHLLSAFAILINKTRQRKPVMIGQPLCTRMPAYLHANECTYFLNISRIIAVPEINCYVKLERNSW